MLSQNIRRQSQLLLKNSVPSSSPSSLKQIRRICLLRLHRAHALPGRCARQMSSLGASETPAEALQNNKAQPASGLPEDNGGKDEEPVDAATVNSEEMAKVRVRRARLMASSLKDAEPMELPEDLNLFWLPEDLQPGSTMDLAGSSDLPPPEILEEAYNNLLITLHPQMQHRAIYPPNADTPVEPTLGIYCPIEGGEYIIDATVRELARRTGAEVLVLDSVQLAAGESGQFGKAANSLQLPLNPLKFPSLPQHIHPARPDSLEMEFDADEDSGAAPVQQVMTLLLAQPQFSQGRSLIPASTRRSPSRSQIKVFFDTLVNSTPPPIGDSAHVPTTSARPRIIYIRDFTTLASTSSVWYAPLLSAVRQRRRGPVSRPSSAISNPMTIVFGMTPPLFSPIVGGSSGSNVLNFLMNQNSSPGMLSQEVKPEKVDWSESEQAERARERRLQDRLKKWEKHEGSLMAELPRLTTNTEEDSLDSAKPEVIVIGPGGRGAFPPALGSPQGIIPARGGRPDKGSSFFRTSVLVPVKRSHSREKAMRLARRREINELSMRMGVGAVGGNIEQAPAGQYFDHQVPEEPPFDPQQSEASAVAETSNKPDGDALQIPSEPTAAKKTEPAPEPDTPNMWEDWGSRIEVWADVKKIADSAVGRVLASSTAVKPSLDSTLVPWSSVQSAWKAHKGARDNRKSWMKDIGLTLVKGAEEAASPDGATPVDEIVERVRNESDLDAYEQRLLGCIVDSASMPTSFSQVHLAPHIIDSVRTIVSLPLLHPHAFQQGILKQHGMTGCLLFGPPGTGKTLVVRALAKEAGCRMLAITPSDIMDMYVGEAEKLVRATFSLARRLSPCVIFLDELDSLFGARMAARESGGAAAAHRGVITEFMQEMDGLKSSREDGIIVIGATNRPFDLDDAILRRLPRRLLVDLPGEKEREEILKILLRDEVIGPDVTTQMLAQKTESFSGSDLKHLCVSAALDSVKENVHVPWLSSPQITVPAAAASEVASTDATPAIGEGPAATTGSPTTGVAVTESPETTIAETATDSPVVNTSDEAQPPATHSRTLHLRNFMKALKEITPSSSEVLGSLADLRKWNEEFGEGHGDRKRKQVWGRGRFGFVDERAAHRIVEEAKVIPPPPSS